MWHQSATAKRSFLRWSSYITFSFILMQKFQQENHQNPKTLFLRYGAFDAFVIQNAERILANPQKGAIFENMVIADYLKQMHHRNDLSDLWFGGTFRQK